MSPISAATPATNAENSPVVPAAPPEPVNVFTALHLRIGLVAVGLLCLGLSHFNAWLQPEDRKSTRLNSSH